MIKSAPFANAATAVTLAFYIICWILVYVAPDLVFSIAGSWFHLVNLDVLRADQVVPLEVGLMGLVSIGVVTWVTTYVWIELYNRWAKK